MQSATNRFALVVGVILTAALGHGQDHEGKALFVKARCNTCHSVESRGIEAARDGNKSADLSDVAELVPSAEWAKKYLLREEEKDGKKHRRPWKGDAEDLDKIIEWLMTTESP